MWTYAIIEDSIQSGGHPNLVPKFLLLKKKRAKMRRCLVLMLFSAVTCLLFILLSDKLDEIPFVATIKSWSQGAVYVKAGITFLGLFLLFWKVHRKYLLLREELEDAINKENIYCR